MVGGEQAGTPQAGAPEWRVARSAADLQRIGEERLPALIGMEVLHAEPGRVECRMPVRDDLLAPNGYLHAASVIALADTACGYGTVLNLPPEAVGFTTVELKSNFLGTVREGVVRCEAVPAHRGRTTHVWDARVWDAASERTLALFRCTQMILAGGGR